MGGVGSGRFEIYNDEERLERSILASINHRKKLLKTSKIYREK
jgi:hypothetical protein